MSDKITVELTEKEHKVYKKFVQAEKIKEKELEITKCEKKIADLKTKLKDEEANLGTYTEDLKTLKKAK